MSVTENEVQVGLRGNPRWWTMTNDKGTREIVRLEVELLCNADGRRYRKRMVRVLAATWLSRVSELPGHPE